MKVHRHIFAPTDTLDADLIALGVKEDTARRWARLGGAQVGTLRRLGNTFVWEVHRKLSRQLVLTGVSVANESGNSTDSRELADLVQDLIEQAREAQYPLVKAQIDSDQVGERELEAVLREVGFVPLPTPASRGPLSEDSATDGWVLPLDPNALESSTLDPNALESSTPGPSVTKGAPPYLRQRTDFTCGPTSLLMGRPDLGSDFQTEIQLWRESTYVVGASPHGLALAATRRRVPVRILATTDEPILTGPASGSLPDATVANAIHSTQVADSIAAGVPTRVGPVQSDELIQHLTGGGKALVLIDEADLNGESCAHWVLAWRVLDGQSTDPTVLVHDPWTDTEFGETWVESYAMAIGAADLWQIAKWGPQNERALILI